MGFYKLNKNFPVTDYRGREVFVPNWEQLDEPSEKVTEDYLIDHEMPYGIYCIEDDDEVQYFEYFNKDLVPDAMFSIYFWNREPTCASFRIHYAEKEVVGKKKPRERYTGRVFSSQEVFIVPEVLGEMEYIGDWHPDELIGTIYEQFKKEEAFKNRRPQTGD